MTRILRKFGPEIVGLLFAAAALVIFVTAAFSQTVVLDQQPSPSPTQNTVSELMTQSYAVSGGTLYISTLAQSRQNGGNGQPQAVSSVFVPTGAGGGLVRYLALTNAKSDLGVPMTATPGTPSGTVGVTRTAGSVLVLTGEATSGAANKTDKALFELDLADTYIAGANIAVTVNCNYSGTVVTTAGTTMTVAAYTEVNGVETAIAGITAAQLIPATAGNLTFTIPGTGLVPGSHIAVELVMLVTSASGAVTGQINSVALTD
jgi:hypothetical protein